MKNLKKMTREYLKSINGGIDERPCRIGEFLCYTQQCTLMCMDGSQCQPSLCID